MKIDDLYLRDYDDSEDNTKCNKCGNMGPAFIIINNKYLCLNCFNQHHEVLLDGKKDQIKITRIKEDPKYVYQYFLIEHDICGATYLRGNMMEIAKKDIPELIQKLAQILKEGG